MNHETRVLVDQLTAILHWNFTFDLDLFLS